MFHHLTYEAAGRDIDAIVDPRERRALEAQVKGRPVLLTLEAFAVGGNVL